MTMSPDMQVYKTFRLVKPKCRLNLTIQTSVGFSLPHEIREQVKPKLAD